MDDHEDGAKALALLLQFYGHDVRKTYSGLEALQIVREFQPTIVLLDIVLPDLDGYEVARRIRTEPDMPPCMLFAVTGLGPNPTRSGRCRPESTFI